MASSILALSAADGNAHGGKGSRTEGSLPLGGAAGAALVAVVTPADTMNGPARSAPSMGASPDGGRTSRGGEGAFSKAKGVRCGVAADDAGTGAGVMLAGAVARVAHAVAASRTAQASARVTLDSIMQHAPC